MKVAVGCDHRGFEGKRTLIPLLKKMGHQVHDFGCDSTAACDYPDFAGAVARAVVSGEHEVGILLDGSGIGMSVAANKVYGARAALVHDEVTARLAREYNHCNVLCIGTDLLSHDAMRKIVEIFLTCPFMEGRHTRRVNQIHQIELDSIGAHRENPHHSASPAAAPAAVSTPVTVVHRVAATSAR